MIPSFLKKYNGKLLLYTGLSFLLIAIVIRGLGGSNTIWIPIFILAILLKTMFLFVIFRARKFKWSLWLTLIVSGVILIFISLLFKYVFPIPLLRDILFYSAIFLKITGLILIFIEKVLPSGKKDE